ncbi:hypothetical protein A2914_01990 [Candidatus Nomurabacteria bacterium RIFCSPLOWO2_01_FULL_41_21]|uniref:Uncharacterized protein n=2 Tax=Candidatus Nomuraibacteriota TaxID=1752729 RepID=A0A1F6X3C2_9BACT|nr:MAG: hypothetical protein A2914_01990 [Candidatus Nomurabacteria bacterium RIFCSPLOWO2_01_FULL_41_21]
MISRKMILFKRGTVTASGEFPFKTPEMEEIKYIIVKKIKNYGYAILISTLRFSIKSTHFAKTKSKDLIEKIKTKFYKNEKVNEEVKEVSKFLKSVSEYKNKIKKIKSRIKEEEGIE